MNNTQAVLNFIYFTYNHRDLTGLIERAFGKHLGSHFVSKLKGGSPKDVLDLVLEMSEDNQELFIQQVEKEYRHKKGI
jgi:hypothetical protein